ncbi:MAG: PD-(D/E)XK nuclease family protein [Desulfovibrionaceae bacterium]|nr:PD-(D/E)XK nuclease family protein [Desulfovibrionaceae bacterium]
MSGSPFLLFPWSRPFLPDIIQYVAECTENHPERALLLVPIIRSKRYIHDLYRKASYTGLLPHIITLAETAREWQFANDCDLRPEASLLDMTALLFRAVKRTAETDEFLRLVFGNVTLQTFWPWGMRLHSLLEELYKNAITPADINTDAIDISDSAKALIRSLGRIHEACQEELASAGLTTKGYELYQIATRLKKIPALLTPSKERLVFLCGFGLLEGAEDRMYRKLWEAGARVLVHGDPKLVTDPQNAHHACRFVQSWCERWHAGLEAAPFPERAVRPDIAYHEGYDAHSELLALKATLEEQKGRSATCALVLANPDLLLPTLHHLPDKNVNISMGYPLTRTFFGQFVSVLIRLQVRKTASGYYWRDILHVIRHTYFTRLLAVQNVEDPCGVVAKLQNGIAEGMRYQDIKNLAAHVLNGDPAQEAVQTILACLVDAMANVTTLEEFAGCLDRLLALLPEEDETRNQLDAKAITSIRHGVIPLFRSSLVAQEKFTFLMLERIVGDILSSESIPFEADPLLGLQIVGLAETMLLHFDTVVVLDASDEILPGIPGQDPLLPEELRQVTGLPTLASRQLKSEYNLFRLIAGSDSVHLFWQEGVQRNASVEGKRSRSRFVEQMLWEDEQRLGHLVEDEAPMYRATARIKTPVPVPSPVKRTAALEERLASYLARTRKPGISATALDNFRTCPLLFARRYLLMLEPANLVDESDANGRVGSFIHDLLKDLCTPYIGQAFSKNTIAQAAIEALFDKKLANEEASFANMPTINYLVLKTSTKTLLGKYFASLGDTKILALEKRFYSTVTVGSRPYLIYGTLDRIDRRKEQLIVLDYKTSSLKKPAHDIWGDREFFTAIDDAVAGRAEIEDLVPLIEKLREYLPSIQLPFYMVLSLNSCQDEYKSVPSNAALIELATGGKEYPLFPDKCTLSDLERQTYCQSILSLLLYTLSKTKSFEAVQSDECQFCQYADLCKI